MNDDTKLNEQMLRRILREELQPIRERQDTVIRHQAHLLKELSLELDNTQRALAMTRGALKGHAEGLGRFLGSIVAPVVAKLAMAAGIVLLIHYGLRG